MLPICEIRDDVLTAIDCVPIVVTAPTGTGKSTEIPRWLSGRVLVVEPRRVACRAVAQRIADNNGTPLGEEVGYRVRDDDCSTPGTRLLVVTPGIVLSSPKLLEDFDVVVLDEFHERRLDTDLILALLVRQKARFIVMSATLDGEGVAEHVEGKHLRVASRLHPVDIDHDQDDDSHPTLRGLETRVRRAVERLAPEGDILVFVPGKATIESVASALDGLAFDGSPLEVVQLHGQLSLEKQAQALRPGTRRRVVVTTNVAETSVTVPGVRAVVDSGLVRRTSYHAGRSYLGLTSVARDSADQRAGRAGRTGPGKCVRLWGRRALLEGTTPPEIHRESLVPLVMTAASLGVDPAALPYLDPPRDFAIEDATRRLRELGAVDEMGSLTARGERLQKLPLDPALGQLLVESERSGCLQDAIDLVAALDQGRPSDLVRALDFEADLHPSEADDCDAVALIAAIRRARPAGHARPLFREARQTSARLRTAFDVAPADRDATIDREPVLRAMLRADPAAAHVARRRKNRTAWSNGGTEIDLARESLAERNQQRPKPAEALIVLATHALAAGARGRKILATAASPIPLRWLVDAKLGEEQVGSARLNEGRLAVEVERTWAGKVIGTEEREPVGTLARRAMARLFVEGRFQPRVLEEAKRRVSRRALAARLGSRSAYAHFSHVKALPELAQWFEARLEELGMERSEDLELLSPGDLLPDDVPAELAPQLDSDFPLEVDVGDCKYSVEYDLERNQALLSIVKGQRAKPPPASYLPRFEGFRVLVEAGGVFHRVR